MRQPTVSFEQDPPKPPAAKGPFGFALGPGQKGLLLVAVLGVLYLRLWRRKKARNLVCSHCGKVNPPHRANCEKCSAPLFRA